MVLTGTATLTASARTIKPSVAVFSKQQDLKVSIRGTHADVSASRTPGSHQASIKVTASKQDLDVSSRKSSTRRERRTTEVVVAVTGREEEVYAD